MKNLIIIAFLSTTLFLTACEQNGESQQALEPVADESVTIATVNGKPVTEATLSILETEIAQRNRGAKIPREQLIEELVNRALLYQEAEKKQLDKQADVAPNLEFLRLSLLSQAAMQDFLKKNAVSDEEINQEYNEKIAGTDGTEYKARHILTKKEEDAKSVIEQLQKGAKFEHLAKAHSTGPSKTKGGDLGWFSPSQMVPPFAEAVVALKKGEYTTTPVKTQFGWHVILLEGSRNTSPPALNLVKARIKATLQRQKIKKHLDELRTNATIVMAETKISEEPQAEKKPQTSEPTNSQTNNVDAPAAKTQPQADTPSEPAGEAEPKKEQAQAE